MLLTNRPWTYHFTCDVTVTSFLQGIVTKIFFSQHPQYIQVCVCQVSCLQRYCEEDDVTVTSFLQGIVTNFFSHNIHNISRYVCAKFRACRDIARKKMLAKMCPPAAGGWRGGPAAAGLRKKVAQLRLKQYPVDSTLTEMMINVIQL